MTDKKILSPSEALRALADGKKLTCDAWRSGTFVHLDMTDILFNNGDTWGGSFDDFYEYNEPAPKVVWVEYLATPAHTGTNSGGAYFFREDDVPNNSMWHYTPTGRKMEV